MATNNNKRSLPRFRGKFSKTGDIPSKFRSLKPFTSNTSLCVKSGNQSETSKIFNENHDEETLRLGSGRDTSSSSSGGDWRVGRRVVDLNYVAKQLNHCKMCKNPLRLDSCIGESRYGLASILYVQCDEDTCQVVNDVHTGKRHATIDCHSRKCYDVNTKLAAGMLHAGIGPTHVNALLTSMNIPPVDEKTLKRREREVGKVIEVVARQSCKDASEMERSSTISSIESTELPVVKIPVSYDMCWQKRGRAHNSLTGAGSVMGFGTKKVLDYSTRNKHCKMCDMAREHCKSVTPHDCRKNHDGSSKSMESSVAVELFKRSGDAGLNYSILVGDDDSTTLSKLRAEVDENIGKWSDIQHAKRAIGNQLHNIKNKHKELTQSVIEHIQYCFACALKQNKENVSGIKKALPSIVSHIFGDHNNCDTIWCKALTNPNYLPKHLPRQKYLNSDLLRADLNSILQLYASNADKLAPLGSSQQNESLNNIIGSKAPKIRHYGCSESNDFRVAAAVAQKNLGRSYISKAVATIKLSPGVHTCTFASKQDKILSRKQKDQNKAKYKKRRRELKEQRSRKKMRQEVREGTQYEQGCGYHNIRQTVEIPGATVKPELIQYHPNEENIIIFDLETTGTGHDAEITQISAIGINESRETVFNSYVLPENEITPRVQHITHLQTAMMGNERRLLYNGNVVPSTSIAEGLTNFAAFLDQQKNPVVLVGHNTMPMHLI